MLPKTYKELLDVQNELKRKWLVVNSRLNEKSGIYILTRHEDGIRYAYVGQAKHILSRLVSHLQGYELHIDKSLRKHGLFSQENPTGWYVNFANFDEQYLDDKEKLYINTYAQSYQMLNKTLGGQGEGKKSFDYERQPKGYKKGVEYGRQKVLGEVAVFFERYLDYSIKGKSNKVKERKLEEFKKLIGGSHEIGEGKIGCIQNLEAERVGEE